MKETLNTIFRRKWHFIWFFATMVVVPMTLVYVIPAKYKAQATILLTPGRFNKPFMPDEMDTHMSFMQVSMEDVSSEVELMTSNPVLARAVDENHLDQDPEPPRAQLAKFVAWHILKALNHALVATGLLPDLPPREEAISRLYRKLDVDMVKRSNIINVKWKGSSPEQAQNVVNSVVRAYLQHHIEVHGINNALGAVKQEMDTSYVQMLALEDTLKIFNAQHSLSEIETQRSELLAKLSLADSKAQTLASFNPDNLTSQSIGSIVDDPGMEQLLQRLTDAQLKRLDLVTHYGPEDRKLITNQQEINEIKKLIREGYEKSLSSWRSQAATYRKQFEQLDKLKIQVDRIKRDIDDKSHMYTLNRAKVNEIELSKAMDTAEVAGARVVQYAQINNAPAIPKIIILAVSIFFGLVFGTVYVFWLDKLSQRFLKLDEVESLTGLPVLASIPEYRKGKYDLVQAVARELVPVGQDLFPPGTPRDALKAILITSTSTGVGTSFIAQNLAHVARLEEGVRAIWVSFVHLHQSTGEEGAKASLKAVCESPESHIEPGPGGESDRILVEIRPEDVDLFDNKVRRLVERLRQLQYHVAVFDVTSEKADTFYLKFLPFMDHVILVAGYDRTSKQAMVRMVDLIKRFHGRLAGCIFNRRQNVIPEFVYKKLF